MAKAAEIRPVVPSRAPLMWYIRKMKRSAVAPKKKAISWGKLPVVILPLAQYERMKEDLEMLQSKRLERQIRKARTEVKKGKVVSLQEVMAKLGIS